jgi:hypothetical protein
MQEADLHNENMFLRAKVRKAGGLLLLHIQVLLIEYVLYCTVICNRLRRLSELWSRRRQKTRR